MRRTLSGRQLIQCASLCHSVYGESDDWLWHLSHEDKLFYIALKGTDDLGDWKTNLSFLFKHEDTHDGFKRNAWAIIVNILLSGIMNVVDKDYGIVLTGHSLGGATAIVLADLLQNHYSDLVLATFGAPRPGGRRLRNRLLGMNHYRFVYGSDLVPSAPPYTNGYVHTHPAIHLDDLEVGFCDIIHDHRMSGYILALESLLHQKESCMHAMLAPQAFWSHLAGL